MLCGTFKFLALGKPTTHGGLVLSASPGGGRGDVAVFQLSVRVPQSPCLFCTSPIPLE